MLDGHVIIHHSNGKRNILENMFNYAKAGDIGTNVSVFIF